MLTSVRIFKEPRLVKIVVIASHAFDSLLDAVSDCLNVSTVGKRHSLCSPGLKRFPVTSL